MPGPLNPSPLMPPLSYKGYAIEARTFQIRGSGRWTMDLLISRRGALRAFSSPTTFPTEAAAIAGCRDYASKIIDGRIPGFSVDDLD